MILAKFSNQSMNSILHKIDCWGKMKFLKAGRAGLIFSALDANAGTSNEDWRDEDDWVEIG